MACGGDIVTKIKNEDLEKYRAGEWKGLVKYACPLCHFDSVNPGSFRKHMLSCKGLQRKSAEKKEEKKETGSTVLKTGGKKAMTKRILAAGLMFAVIVIAPAICLAERGTITAITAPTNYATSASSITWTQGDSVNGHKVVLTGREVVIMMNTAAVIQGATIQSVADPYGRTGDATYNIPASSGVAVFQMFPTAGWIQSNGYLYIDVSSNTINLAVIKFP